MEQIIEVLRENAEQTISVEREPLLIGGEGTLEISNDGSYDVRQYSNVEVNVVDGTQEITTEGLHDVTHAEFANVKTTHGTTEITENGLHDVKTYEDASVNVQPVLTTKSITENGTYNAIDDNAQGYSSVEVDVPDTGEKGLYKAMIEGTAVNVVDDKLTSLIGCRYANVITLTAKQCTEIVTFQGNSTIKIIKLPKLYQMPMRAFYGCASLTDVIVPLGVGGAHPSDTSNQRHFASCPKLKHIVAGRGRGFREFEGSFNIETMVFTYPNVIEDLITTSLHTLVILQNDVTLGSVASIPSDSPIAQGTGYIYVPESDVESCKQRTNWTVYADQIKGINEQVTLSVGDTFTPSYSGSDVVTWDIVKLCSWDCATINSSTGEITVIDEGYLLVQGLDTDGIPIYVAYINSLEVEE